MDNEGISSQVSRNTVKYEIYLSKKPNQNFLQDLKERVKSIVGDNDWQLDFKVNLKHKLIYGTLTFEQNIEEEWLIVFVMRELSKSNSDMVIRIKDDDGEILLIEAAEYLPRWLESNVSKRRVYIHKGKIHIIPEHIDLKPLSKSEIAQIVRDPNVNTQADPFVQDAIKEQLSEMPNRRAWLAKKFDQLDHIISDSHPAGEMKPFEMENLTLASVSAMADEDLDISPLSSLSSSPI